MSVSSSSDEPLVTFGVLTDVQYADCDDKPAGYDPSLIRYYRNALNQVERAYMHWSRVPGLSLVLQLGDLIDQHNQGCHRGLDRVLEALDSHGLPTYHTLGNHELYNCSRRALAGRYLRHRTTQHSPSDNPPEDDPVFYYSFTPVPGVKLISLDCFEVSVLGRDPDEPLRREAAQLLAGVHGNWDEPSWEWHHDLVGLDQRFIDSNGALSQMQLDWLDSELSRSDAAGEQVVVFGHLAVAPDSASADCLLWNYEEVMRLFGIHPCVCLYLCGHTHRCGYARDSHGVHYMALAGIIETAPHQSAFSTVSMFPDRIKVSGTGREESRILWTTRNDTRVTTVVGPEEVASVMVPAVRVAV